jgi:hypothetical protein
MVVTLECHCNNHDLVMFGPSLGSLGSFMAFKNHCGNEKLVVYGMSRVRACTRKTEIN